MPKPPAEVIEALQSTEVLTTRRLEIYESDGITPAPFVNAGIFADGSVSIGSGSERRTLECTLDNSAGNLLVSENAFWYDKVLRPFKGVRYTRKPKKPDVILLGITDTQPANIAAYLFTLGANSVTYLNVNNVAVTDLVCDMLVVVANNISLGTASGKLVTACEYVYNNGGKVFTFANVVTVTANLRYLYTGIPDTTPVGTYSVTDSGIDSPVRGQVKYDYMNNTSTRTYFANLTPEARAIGKSNGYVPIAYVKNSIGGFWIHTSFIPMMTISAPAAITNIYANLFSMLFPVAEKEGFWECQLGEFMITSLNDSSDSSLIKINASDYSLRLQMSKIPTAFAYPVGTNVATMITGVAGSGGITKFRIAPEVNFMELSTELTFDRNTDRWEILTKASQNVNIDIYFDYQGYLVAEPYRDPTTALPDVSFRHRTSDGNVIKWERQIEAQIINSWNVLSDDDSNDANGQVFSALVQNTEPSSKTSIAAIGERSDEFISPAFKSNDECYQYGKRLLSVSALEAYSLSLEVISVFWADAGWILSFYDPDIENNFTNFLLTDFTVSLRPGTTSLSAKRIAIIGYEYVR